LLSGQQQLQQGINGGVRSYKNSKKIRKWFKVEQKGCNYIFGG
jgi:hypothetical protein